MVTLSYEASFASVAPVLRAREIILADLKITETASATEIAKSKVAEIEFHIKNGDEHYQKSRYSNALEEFKTARALIYQALYPGFDVRAFIAGRKDIVLPTSQMVEKQIMELSLRLIDNIRPKTSEPELPWHVPDEMPEPLQPYTTTDFREAISFEEFLQSADLRAVALLGDAKAESAVGLLEEALVHARGQHVNSSLIAATSLNLASAYLEMNDARHAAEQAQSALELFRENNDLVGQAQALHLASLSAQKANEEGQAKELLTLAAETLQKAGKSGSSGPEVQGGIVISRDPADLRAIVDGHEKVHLPHPWSRPRLGNLGCH